MNKRKNQSDIYTCAECGDREIIVEKNKLGPVGKFKLRANLSTGKFDDYVY